MSPDKLADALFPKARLAVLKELWLAEEGLHLREIERRSGLNKRGLLRELYSLRNAGILLSKQTGSRVTYWLNPDCPIHDELCSIVRKTVGPVDVLQNVLLAVGDQVDLAYVYGSCATGHKTIESDVDVMIVGSVKLTELASSLQDAAQLIGREINPTTYTKSEYNTELDDENSFVGRVHSGPRLILLDGET